MRTQVYRLILVLMVAVGLILFYAGAAMSSPVSQGGQEEPGQAPVPSAPHGLAPPPLQNQPDSSGEGGSQGSEDAVSGELLVKAKDETRRTEMASLHARLGAQVVNQIDDLGVQVVEVPKDQTQAALAAYQADPLVDYAEPNYIAHAYDTPNDSLLDQQWAITKIKLPAGWNWTHGSSAVIIAVLDTGVEFGHPDLQGKLVSGYDFVNNDSIPDDDHGHGTHVSGIAAAATNNANGIAGVCWECRVMPVKVLSASGSGTHAAIAEGITWATDHGARVINMSLGGFSGSATLAQAVTYAWNHNVVVVAAAGNENTSSPSYPAAYPEAISVAATDSSDSRASFSNYGSTIDVAAPGVSILSSVRGGGYQAWSGTSMASPHVAGLAGLIISQNTSRSAATVRQIIEGSADDLGTSGRDDSFGYGRINAERALGGSTIATSTPPRPTSTPTVTPTRDPCAEGENPTELEQQVIDLVNNERRNAGLTPVQTDVRLVEAARLHSQDMANNSFLSHTGSNGSSPWDRIAQAGYPMITGGETIGGGYTTAQAIVQGWMDSSGHRAILLNGEFRDIGVGYAYNAASTHYHYWTADFGVSQDGGERPPTPTGTPDCPTKTPSVTPTLTPSVTPSLTPSPNPTLCTDCTVVTVTPSNGAAGWMLSSEPSGNHFLDDDMYTGFFGSRIYNGAVQFDLRSLPAGARVIGAWVQLTGQTREYMATSGGQWNLRLLPDSLDANWSSRTYSEVHNASVLATIPPDIFNSQLNAYVVNTFTFTEGQLQYIHARLNGTGLISFRLDGPASGDNNAFSWDTGRGEGNIGAPPKLFLTLSGGAAIPTKTPVTPSPTPGASVTRTPTMTKSPVPVTLTPSRTPSPPSATLTPVPPTATRPASSTVVVTITPAETAVGWVMGNEASGNHFGDDDIYSGIFSGWIHHGAIQFNLATLPAGVQIVGARVTLTGQTTYYLIQDGTWRLQLLGPAVDSNWSSSTYASLHAADILYTVPPPVPYSAVGVGVANTLVFDSNALSRIEQRKNTTGLISFRVDGPESGADNVFSWDSGYGVGGLGIKPILAIEYVTGEPGATSTPLPTSTSAPTNTPRPSPTATPDNSQTVTVEVRPDTLGVGWVRQGDSVSNHWGDDDVYAGIFSDYVYFGAVQFRLTSIPQNAEIVAVQVEITGQTREYTLASGGEWNLRLLDAGVDARWSDLNYDAVASAGIVGTIPPTLQNGDLQAGQRNTFTFTSTQLAALKSRVVSGLISFRLDGPLSGTTNVFSWDSGYGTGGLLIPPVLRVTYRVSQAPPTE